MFLWKSFLKRCNVVSYMDNDGVRDCLIACHCPSANATAILDACVKLENELEWNVWYSRVPTESNVADEPSRLETSTLDDALCIRDDISCDDLWLLLIVKRGGEPPAALSPT